MDKAEKALYENVNEYNSKPSVPPRTPVDVTETPQKCVFESENDDSVVTIKQGEVCTIDTAKAYGLFGKDKYFNDLMSLEDVEQTDIFLTDRNSGEYQYSLCEKLDNDKIYQNCSMTTGNPWKTLDSTNNYCMIPLETLENSLLPHGLKLVEGTKTIQKPAEVPIAQPKKTFCQEKWYDWFSIPDYHHGNVFGAETTNTSNIDLPKCYTPCKVGFVPHPINKTSCVRKQDLDGGIYANSFHYLPIPLIILLGSTKEDILLMYKQNVMKTRAKTDKISLDIDILGDLLNNKNTQNKIFVDVKNDLNYNIAQLLSLPFDETNINAPSDEKHQRMFDVEKIEIAYNIAKRFHDMLRDENQEIFNNYKKQLCLINGLNMEDNKLFKQLLVLKKACNVVFDNRTVYSSDMILYTLNKHRGENDVKQPIVFEITDDDIIVSLSTNSAERTSRDEQYSSRSGIEDIKKSARSKHDFSKEDARRSYQFVENEYDEENDHVLQKVKVKQSQFYDPITLISGFFLIIFIIFGVYILYLIAIMFRGPISTVVNNSIISYYSMIFWINDLMSGGPPKYHLKMNELQQGFLESKLNNNIAV
jgi:hypothetical protein